MTTMSIPTEIQSPLRQVRRLRIVRALARAVIVVALAVLSVEASVAVLWSSRHPESVHRFFEWLPVGLWITLATMPLLLILAIVRHRRLHAIAESAERQFSSLGLRLSTSLEAPEMPYCPPPIRNAVWQDTASAMAGVAWRTFLARLSTSVWVALAIALLLIQFLLFPPPSTGDGGGAAVAAVPPLPPPTAPLPPFKARLKIVDPSKDLWATKVEAIPLTIAGDSPLGFQNLRLSVSVNGAPAVLTPLDNPTLAAGVNQTTAELYLDELTLQDYDVVAYSIVGEAIRPNEKPANVGAPMQFIQIRPFQKDIREMNGGGSAEEQMADLLIRLIEDQRKVVKGTWLLKSNADLDAATQAYQEMGTFVTELQEDTHDLTTQAAETFRSAGAEAQGFSAAAAIMRAALDEMETSQWDKALSPTEQALAMLVDMLRHTQEKIAKGKAAGKPKPKPKPQGLKDRQTVRKEKEAAKSELEQLAREQEQLNQDAKDAAKQDDQVKRQQFEKQLAAKQKDLAQRTEKAANDPKRGENAKDLVKDAAAKMNENAEQLSGQKPEAEKPAAQPEGDPSAGSCGAQAAARLHQAAAAEAAEKSARQAGDLREMLDEMARLQADAQQPSGQSPQVQKDAAAKLGEMTEKLDDMANSPNAKGKEELKQAAEATDDAARKLDQGKGDDKTMQKPINAVAKAYEKSTGQPQHLEQLKQEMTELQRQLEGLQNQADRKEGELSPEAREWLKHLADRGAGLEGQLKTALGDKPAVRKFEDQLKQMMRNQPDRETHGGGTEQVRTNLPGPRPGTDPANKTAGDAPTRSGEGKPPGDKPAAGGKPGDEPAAGRPPGDQPAPGDQPGQQPGESPAAGKAGQPSPKPGDQPGAGKGTAEGPGESEGDSGDGDNRLGRPTMTNVAVVKELGPWRDTFAGLQAELDAKLLTISPRDVLRAMSADDTPPEYRDWVNAYYERLSRQLPETAEKK